MLFIYLCTTFIKRIIHNLICSGALCMRKKCAMDTLYDCFVNECDTCVIICVVDLPVFATVESNFTTYIRGASLRQTKIIIRYIHIRYTRFLAKF